VAKIIDISEKLKKKLLAPTQEDMQSYEVRTTFCEKSIIDKGFCDCNVCIAKEITVTKVLELVRQDLYELGKKERTPMFYADVLEVLYSSIHRLTEALDDPSNE
jgi:hypothetical protein